MNKGHDQSQDHESSNTNVLTLDTGQNQNIEISIIGNPNVGKTSLFNILTGAKQYVANWPGGVTVEKKGWYIQI